MRQEISENNSGLRKYELAELQSVRTRPSWSGKFPYRRSFIRPLYDLCGSLPGAIFFARGIVPINRNQRFATITNRSWVVVQCVFEVIAIAIAALRKNGPLMGYKNECTDCYPVFCTPKTPRPALCDWNCLGQFDQTKTGPRVSCRAGERVQGNCSTDRLILEILAIINHWTYDLHTIKKVKLRLQIENGPLHEQITL